MKSKIYNSQTKSLPNSLHLLLICLTAACLFSLNAVTAQVLLTSGAPTYTQNFSSFGTTTATWTDNVTLPNWYATLTSLTAGTGSSATAGLYNFGVLGTNPLAERALGTVNSTSVNAKFGVNLKNNDASAITNLTIAFTGEEWRRVASAVDPLLFEYSTNATSLSTGTWTGVSALNFTAPVNGTAGALDGNAAANHKFTTANFALSVAAGSQFWLRWYNNTLVASHGLAVDDITITAGYGTLCSSPTALSVISSSITDVSANISFTGSGSSFIAEYGPVGFIPGLGATAGGGTVTTGASSPITLTGLSSATTYEVYIRQDCGGGSYSANSISTTFLTAPANPVPQPIPYSQNFNGLAYTSTAYPAGWQGWTSGAALPATYNTGPATGNLALTASASASSPTTAAIGNYGSKIGYLPGSSAANADAQLVLAINNSSNTGSVNTVVQYDIMVQRETYNGVAQTIIDETTLQYRIGIAGSFTTLTGAEYQSTTVTKTTAGDTSRLNPLTIGYALPLACNGQSNVQLRWLSRKVSGSGNFPAFAVSNVYVSIPSSPPVANYNVSASTICPNQCVTFTDQSTNGPTSWSWTFAGGTPSSSSARNPGVCYTGAAPGTYAVSLTATNALGSNTFNGVITVNGALSGTVSVGPTGNYPTITTALFAAQNCGFTGNLILELQPTYVSTFETFPITFSAALGSSSPSHTITLRPAAGATGLALSSTSAAIVIDLNGVQGIIIDGQPGGTGGFASYNLSISGSHASVTIDNAAAVRFINDAKNNQIIYSILSSDLEYSSVPYSSGIIKFGTSAGGSGNSNNTIDHCLFQAVSGTTTLIDGISSIGSTVAGQENSSNIISNNNFDFAASTGQSFITFSTEYGIYLADGNQTWTIAGNSFYSSGAQSWQGASSAMIKVIPSTSSVNGCVINNNFFGGSAAQCGGTRWTSGNNNAMLFQCISVKAGTTTPTNIQGNTLQNVMIWAYNHYTNHAFIDVIDGSVNIGTVSPNIMGSQSAPNSILFETGNNTTNDGQALNGIIVESTASTGTINIKNNLIGSISFFNRDGTNALEYHHFYGISFAGAGSVIINIDNNTIGNGITHASGITSNSSLGNVIGIYSGSGSSTGMVNITNNIIDSLSLGGVRTDQYPLCYGIFINGSWSCNITGNTVRNLVNKNGFSGVGADPVVAGISNFASQSSSTISKNQIYNLSTTTSGTVGGIIGMRLAGTLSTVTVDGNLVYQLSPSAAAQTVRGIQSEQGSDNVVSNNMVSLGFDKNGSDITLGADLIGVYDLSGNTSYLSNSVKIGGSGVLTTATNTHAFRSDVASGARKIKNNIFYNARSNGSSTGKHYAVRVFSASGLAINNNDYFTDGTGGVLGTFAGTDKGTLLLWQGATGQDANSLNLQPLFTSNSDLHLQTGLSCAFDGTGATGTGISVDYDNQSRNSPPDIGADEFTSTFSVVANAGTDQINCGTTSTTLSGNPAPGGTSGLWVIISGIGGSITTPSSETSAFGGANGTTYLLKWTLSTNPPGTCSTSDTVAVTFASPISSASCGGTNVPCNGSSNGSASVNVTGGSGTISYLWSNGGTSSSINGLNGGTYTVTVTNPCSVTTCSYTVIEPAVLTASASSNTPVCIGDNTNLSSSIGGGTTPYSYSWSGPNGYTSTNANPTITNTALVNGGTYSLTVTDAHNCTATATTTVSVQNCITTLNLNLLIQGYYLGSGLMNPAMFNEGVAGSNNSQVDTILVELHNSSFPYATAAAVKTILMIDGSATAIYGAFVTGGNYYIAIFHRNAVQTWSAAPVLFTTVTNYSFISAKTQAYGDNQIKVDVSPDLWAFYNGDITQDENIDLIDFPPLDFGINTGLFGYYAADLNGDGNVDLLDFPVLDANISGGVYSKHP